MLFIIFSTQIVKVYASMLIVNRTNDIQFWSVFSANHVTDIDYNL